MYIICARTHIIMCNYMYSLYIGTYLRISSVIYDDENKKGKGKERENRKPLVALVRHAWDTVDLLYPQALGRPCTTCLGYSGPILSLGPWSPLYDMPGIQWTCYIPGPLVALVRHAWDTVDLLYPQAHTGRAEVKECCHDDIDTCVPRDGMALTYRRL